MCYHCASSNGRTKLLGLQLKLDEKYMVQVINAVRDPAQIITAIVKISTDLRRPMYSIFNMHALYDYIRIHLYYSYSNLKICESCFHSATSISEVRH